MGPSPASFFVHFCAIIQIKIVDFSWIRTWIVRVEGEHADHLTATTKALKSSSDDVLGNSFKGPKNPFHIFICKV